MSFSTVCSINGTFYIKFEINECLVVKTLLMNVTKTNEHLNVPTFVHALQSVHANFRPHSGIPGQNPAFFSMHINIL